MNTLKKELEQVWDEAVEGSHCPQCFESFKAVDEVEVCDVCEKEACSHCRCDCEDDNG